MDGKIAAGTNISPEKAKAQENSRLLGTDVNESRAKCHQAPKVEGTMAFDCLMPAGSAERKRDNRFPKSERLRRQKDIEACLREGKRYRHPLMTLYVLWREGSGRRIAFSVGRKVAKRATRRNKIKRWLREAYRIKRWAMREGVDLFVVAQPECAVANFQAIDAALTDLLVRAKVLQPPNGDEQALEARGK